MAESILTAQPADAGLAARPDELGSNQQSIGSAGRGGNGSVDGGKNVDDIMTKTAATTLMDSSFTNNGSSSNASTTIPINSTATSTNTTTTTTTTTLSTIGPVAREQQPRPTPYTRPILLSHDRGKRKKKSIGWQSDLVKEHVFELIADERVNVHKLNVQAQMDETTNASSQHNSASSPNCPASAAAAAAAANNRTNPLRAGIAYANIDGTQRRPGSVTARSEANVGQSEHTFADWRLILIDFTPELPSPGWNSVERTAQAERETYVLGAIDLPGQPSTLDEPDNAPNGAPGGSGGTLSRDEAKIIPLDNPEGMYTEYPASPPRYTQETMLSYY